MAKFIRKTGIAPREYLFSTVGAAFTSKTLSASVVSEDADGNKYVNQGTLMASITSGAEADKIGPYDSGASDGRQTTTNLVGYLDTYANLDDGDSDVGVLYKGTVNTAKVTVDGVLGTVADVIKTALRTAAIDILHRT